MKRNIIKLLKNTGSVVSGETLSKQLGISRVAIWKHIRKLQTLGYNIVSSGKGYELLDSPDACYAWEFPSREAQIHYFTELPSTMVQARQLARKGCPHFTVVVAEQQTKGRGRMQRTWTSATGGLYFTIVLRPKIPPMLSYRTNFAASLAMARLLRSKYGLEAAVKWPNDILVNEKKVAGLLSEMETEADMLSFVNIGIGLNVNNTAPPDVAEAASLHNLVGRKLSRRDLLSAFLDGFEEQINQTASNDIIEQWKKYTVTIGRKVKIVTVHDVYQGTALDVDANGALVLELCDGSTKNVVFGDCFHQ